MAEEKKEKEVKVKSPLIGAQIEPTTLDDTTKIDIDINKSLIDAIIGEGLNGGLDISKIDQFTSMSTSRDQMYQLIDTMAKSSDVAAILKTYTEEICEVADNGHIVWCESTNPKISMFVNYLLNVMNVDKNVYSWAYNLLKYGDVYLKLYRESDYEDDLFNKANIQNADGAKQQLHEELDESINVSIHKDNDKYSYYAEMIADPGTMFELTKYGKTMGYIETPNEEINQSWVSGYSNMTDNTFGNVANFRMKSNDVNIYQADDFVHGCLDDNFTRFPEKVELFRNEEELQAGKNAHTYTVKRGKSLLIDSYKVWREKTLLEDAILLNRLTKSSIVRNIQVEVGDMPKERVQSVLKQIKTLFEQKTAINVGNGMTDYNNPGPVENNVFTATHNGQGAITVNAIGGDIEVKSLGDLDEWVNKFYAAYGVPKAYYGYTDDGAGFNGGTSLAIISSVFAKGVKRGQNAIIQMLTDAINLFLINRGCKSYINNFVLKMKAPLTQEEKDYRDDFTNRVNAISSYQALFGDIEDKTRRLKILKNLIQTLNYGDDLLEIIDDEISATEKALKESEQESAETGTDAGGSGAESFGGDIGSGESTESADNSGLGLSTVSTGEDMDLGNSSQAPTEESFGQHSGTILTEGPDFLIEDENDLPTPEEANGHIDFTRNE